jgi:hypothetical protein
MGWDGMGWDGMEGWIDHGFVYAGSPYRKVDFFRFFDLFDFFFVIASPERESLCLALT